MRVVRKLLLETCREEITEKLNWLKMKEEWDTLRDLCKIIVSCGISVYISYQPGYIILLPSGSYYTKIDDFASGVFILITTFTSSYCVGITTGGIVDFRKLVYCPGNHYNYLKMYINTTLPFRFPIVDVQFFYISTDIKSFFLFYVWKRVLFRKWMKNKLELLKEIEIFEIFDLIV